LILFFKGKSIDGLEISFLKVEIRHAKEVDEIFDAISYNKGASIIRMLQSYLGAEVFQVSRNANWTYLHCSHA
jgi:puromycin-sensitive aminopeptidase